MDGWKPFAIDLGMNFAVGDQSWLRAGREASGGLQLGNVVFELAESLL